MKRLLLTRCRLVSGCVRCGVDAPVQRGFSLLEVIAAILLLAIAFTALIKVAGGAVSLTIRADGYDEAAMWARSKLDSTFAFTPPESGTTEGRFNKNYRWRLQVTPWVDLGGASGGPLRIYQLDLEVFWGASSHPFHAHFSTLRLMMAGA